MTDQSDNNDSAPRPRIRRPSRQGFSSGGLSGSTEANGARVEEDPVVEVIPEGVEQRLNNIVRNMPMVVARPQTVNNDLVTTEQPPPPPTIRERLNRVGRQSTEYERELRLRELHKLLLRDTPLDDIAEALGVSISTVLRDRAELGKRLREESKELDIDFLVGEGSQFYNSVLAQAMDIAASRYQPAAVKLAALRTALGAGADKARFLQATGVLTALQYRRAGEASEKNDLEKMVELTERLLNQADENPLDGAEGHEENLDL